MEVSWRRNFAKVWLKGVKPDDLAAYLSFQVKDRSENDGLH